MSDFTRRDVLGAVAAGGLLAAGGAAPAAEAPADEELPVFRFALGAQKAHEYDGGWARQATAVNFPISKNVAGVLMGLQPGALRELHWHANAAEWAYVIQGQARTTVFSPAGHWQTADFAPGDVWYFPRGYGHSIQGIGREECVFLLGFDNGYFSEFATFSITDWLAHTPREVLAKNLGVPAATFADFPKKEVYIAKGPVPPPLPANPAPGSLNSGPLTHKYRLLAQEAHVTPGGSLTIVSEREFPISTTMTGAIMTLKPGALRELHWHPNADEWQYYLSGRGRMTLFGSSGRARTDDFGPGDVGYAPMGYGHYIENIGEKECRVLLLFNSGQYQEIALSAWLASNPRLLVATNFGIGEDVVARFPKKTMVIDPK
jgi:oxalate decarboxylase